MAMRSCSCSSTLSTWALPVHPYFPHLSHLVGALLHADGHEIVLLLVHAAQPLVQRHARACVANIP
eukprot:256489-Chlamydomonas_euryale.AAC.1